MSNGSSMASMAVTLIGLLNSHLHTLLLTKQEFFHVPSDSIINFACKNFA